MKVVDERCLLLGAKVTLVFNPLGTGIETENPVLVETVGGIPVGKLQFKLAVVEGIVPEMPVGRGMEPDIVGTGTLRETGGRGMDTDVPIDIVGTPTDTDVKLGKPTLVPIDVGTGALRETDGNPILVPTELELGTPMETLNCLSPNPLGRHNAPLANKAPIRILVLISILKQGNKPF